MASAVRTLLPPVGQLADADTRVRHPARLGAWAWQTGGRMRAFRSGGAV